MRARSAASLAIGDKLGAIANVSDVLDALGVSQAIGNPADFSRLERDVTGFLAA